jgi:hypothetical protein
MKMNVFGVKGSFPSCPIIDNSCLGLANTQDERFTPFLVIKIKGNAC